MKNALIPALVLPLACLADVKVTFVGDMLCGRPFQEACRTGADTFDFSAAFAGVKPLFAASDFVVANLETPIAPDNRDLTHERWCFCSPKEYAQAAKDAGVDFVFTANNHCLDRGPEGVKRTIAALDEIGLPHTGTFATREASERPAIVDVKGFKLGLLSYTYGSNAFSNREYLDDGNRFMVNFFQRQELWEPNAREWTFGDRNSPAARAYAAREAKRWPENFSLPVYERVEEHAEERAHVKADVARVKAAKPDFVVMGMHAGGQYNPVETKYTKELASFLADCGVDWIAGAHEHVVHGSDFLGIADGRLTTYSLGNFLSVTGVWGGPHDKMADWSIAWHVYLTRDAKGAAKVSKTTFSVLKLVKGDGTNLVRVACASDLHAAEKDPAAKAALAAGILETARRFGGRSFAADGVLPEYDPLALPGGGFLVDDAVPAGNVHVDAVSNDVVYVRQEYRDSMEWFYWGFRVRGAAGRTLRFRFTDPYGGGPVSSRGPAVTKDGGKTWSYPCDGRSTHKEFTYEFGPEEHETWFYQTFQYYPWQWDAFLARHDDARGKTFVAQELCKSRKGRSVPCARFGCIDKEPKYRFVFTSRHHCQETTGTYVLEGLLERFFGADDLGAWLRENVEAMVVPFVDYDGHVDGDQGKGRKPYDHGRDYGATNLYHETAALKRWIADHAKFRVDGWLDSHSPWMYGCYNEWMYLCFGSDERNNAAIARWGRLLERMQTGSINYRTSCNIPWKFRWNGPWNAGSGTGGAGSKKWTDECFKGRRIQMTYETPFAVANGRVVTPDACREIGSDSAKVLRAFLSDPTAGAETALEIEGVCVRDDLDKLGDYARLAPGFARAAAFARTNDFAKIALGAYDLGGGVTAEVARTALRPLAAAAAKLDAPAGAYEIHVPVEGPEVYAYAVAGKAPGTVGVGPRQMLVAFPGGGPRASACTEEIEPVSYRRIVIRVPR
ncbi:MAG: CapA family protein [Kiritimatiellae bacterium]|nr:CapA family protein [Kiritimatiellia bacterium]